MSSPTTMWRFVWVATGAAWALSSIVLLAGAIYYEPVSLLDWVAVLSYTAAWVLLGASMLLVAQLVPARSVRIAAAVVAIPAIATGLANLIEDGFDVEGASTVYVTGTLLTMAALIVLVVALFRVRAERLGAFTIAVALAMFFVVAGGGLLMLALFAVLSARTGWFRPAET